MTLAACAVHHPPLWYWMAAAAALWGAERAFRFVRFARLNALFEHKRHAPTAIGQPYRDTPNANANAYGMQDLKQSRGFSDDVPYTDKTLPRRPGDGISGTETPNSDFGDRSTLTYYDEGSFQPREAYTSSGFDAYARDGASTPSISTLVPKGEGHFPVNGHDGKRPNMPGHQQGKESVATFRSFSGGQALAPPSVPVGFAQAQLLPSRTIRLTIRVARPFHWAPGQSVLLYLPDLSRIQSHPFTITNNGENEIVLLVKARKGLTRRLFDLVRTRSLAAVGLNGAKDKRLSLAAMRGGEGGVQVPPVYVRAWVDGPMGSASRTKWGDYASVLIICGGSGVSFGVSVFDYLSRTMQRAQSSKRFHTRRIRLCWVVREYGE